LRAVVVADGALQVEERPDPVAGPGFTLVRMRGAGVNNADLMQRAGRYPAPPGAPVDVPGLELAGEVVETGERVMALLGGGAQAELVAVPSRLLMRAPETLGWDEAGGFVEAFATAHDALFGQAQLALGERVLVTGAAGGVGTAAVQLAREAGARVVGTVRNEALRPQVAELGAEVAAPGEAQGPFDVILELIGGDGLAAAPDLLATGGRLVVIGVGAGATAEVDFRTLMGRRARVSASTLRARPYEEKALVVRRLERHVLPLLAAGRIRVPVQETFPLADAEAAYDRFAAGGKLGKIVLLGASP
jgi:NADPH:quinone reductase-like Zn-dependent oxidoreductase